MQVLYKPETIDEFLSREARHEDEFQRLLHRCFLQQKVNRAMRFAYWFTGIGLGVAGAMYVIRWFHLFGY